MDEPSANIGRDIGDEYREAAARSAEIGDGEHQAGRDDANADLGAARHSEGECIAIDAPTVPSSSPIMTAAVMAESAAP